MDNKLIMLVVTLTIGIIMLGSIMMPVLSDATKTTETYTNESAFYVTNEAPYTLTYADGICTANGEIVNVTGSEYSLVFSDAFAVRNYGGSMEKLVTLADIPSVSVNNSFLVSLTIDENLHATLVRNISDVESTSEFDVTYFWGITTEKTDYIMTTGAKPIYVLNDDEIFTVGRTNITNWSNTFEVKGSVESGASAVVIRPPTGITITDAEINYSEIDNRNGYAISTITFNANDTPATYNRMVAPAEVTMEIIDPTFDSSERALIMAIPIMVIAALLLLAVRMFLSNRD